MSEAFQTETRYSWFRLFVTLAVSMVGNYGMWSVIVVMPAVQAEFGIDRADASIPYALTMAGFAIGNAVIGRMVDRFSITRALVISAFLIAVGYLIGSIATSIFVLSVMQVVVGFGTAASFGPLIADISHWFVKRRGIAVAITAR